MIQDAFWVAECCANYGKGRYYTAGPHRSVKTLMQRRQDTKYLGTLGEAFERAVTYARRAKIELQGLNLHGGKIALRAEALLKRIENVANKRGINPRTGEHEYGIGYMQGRGAHGPGAGGPSW